MSSHHEHPHHQASVRRAVAADPTWSILRLSALQRIAGASVLLVALWVAIASTVSWV